MVAAPSPLRASESQPTAQLSPELLVRGLLVAHCSGRQKVSARVLAGFLSPREENYPQLQKLLSQLVDRGVVTVDPHESGQLLYALSPQALASALTDGAHAACGTRTPHRIRRHAAWAALLLLANASVIVGRRSLSLASWALATLESE